jgi:hypothetical protein
MCSNASLSDFNIASRHCGSSCSSSIFLGLVVINESLGVGIELALAQFTLDKEDVGLCDADGGAFAAYLTSNTTRRCSLSLQPRLNQLEQILDAKGPRHLVLQLLHLGGLVVVLARPRRDDVVGHARAARDNEEERAVGLSGRGDVFVAAQVILAIDATVPTPHLAAHHDAIAAVDPLLDSDEALRVLDPLDGIVGLFEREKRLSDERGHGSYDRDVAGGEGRGERKQCSRQKQRQRRGRTKQEFGPSKRGQCGDWKGVESTTRFLFTKRFAADNAT